MTRRHQHAHDTHDQSDKDGVLIRQARRYELVSNLALLGRRRAVYDGLVALSGARPGDRVLDIGCGTGYLSRRVAQAVVPGGEVVGIDPSQPVIDYAAGRAPANCAFEVASAQALPHADGSFDVVVSSLAMHHLPADDRLTALREARRVLRPEGDGRLLIVDFSQRRPPRHVRLISRLGNLRTRHAAAHRHAASPDDLGELIEQAGFRVTGTGDRWPALHYVQAEVGA